MLTESDRSVSVGCSEPRFPVTNPKVPIERVSLSVVVRERGDESHNGLDAYPMSGLLGLSCVVIRLGRFFVDWLRFDREDNRDQTLGHSQ